MKASIFCPVAALLFWLSATLCAAADLVVVDLRYRTAEELLPVLRPLVGTDVSLSAIDYKLLVRGNASDVARIREALAVLDRAPKQLSISVRYGSAPQSNSIDLSARTNKDNKDESRFENRGTKIVVRGGIVTSTATDSNVSSIRVLEGHSAHISDGQSVPVVTAFVLPQIMGRQLSAGSASGGPANIGPNIGIATDYREITSGFDVLPRVNGDRVTLDIATQQQRLTDSNSGSANLPSYATMQRATTTLAGRLGEWIDLGGVSSAVEERRSNVDLVGGSRRTTTRSDRRSISVKIEQVD